ELNYVRPYTYSHLNLFENYGHHFAPLAHPLGANFLEVVHNTALQSNKLFCSFLISYFFKGIDQPNVSWGGDVNKSYLLRPAEYGHTIGQGIPISNFSGRLKMGYLINSRINQMA